MYRAKTLVVALFLIAVPLVAQESSGASDQPIMSAAEFDSRLDFHSSLEKLHELIHQEGSIAPVANRILIFPATVRSVVIYEPAPEDFYAEVELVTGHWEGIEAIRLYRGYLILIGGFFAETVTDQPPREPQAGLVYEGREVLVAGQVVEIGPDDAGNPVPIIVAYDLRVLE